MTSNIDINIKKTYSSCHIDLYDRELSKTVSFYINNAALLTKDITEEDLLNAYSLDNTAIVEATTYTNSLLFTVDADDIELISEDANKMVIYSEDEPIAQITAIKVIDEEGNNLRSSIQSQENGVEVIIEEQVDKATIVVELGSYIESTSATMAYLRTFGELDYWFDLTDRKIYGIDKYYNKTLIASLTSSHIATSNYLYASPAMVSETVFFSNYKKCFFKINGSSITKIKDETSFFGMTYLYDNIWVTAYKNGNSYYFKLIEFTDVETATYEVLDTHTINIGKSASEYCYTPIRIYSYNDKVAISFYSYQFNNYVPTTTDQYTSAKIDKVNKCFDFTNIEPMQTLVYEDEYTLTFNWTDRKYYVDGKAVSGSYSYPIKPLTLLKDDLLYGYETTYSCSSADMVEINLKQAKIIKSKGFLDKMWATGAYAGRKSVDKKYVINGWDIFKDEDIAKRTIRPTVKGDYIIPFASTSSSYVSLTNKNPIFLKKEVIQGKKFLFTGLYSIYQLYQRDNIESSSLTVSENTDIEIRPYSSTSLYFNEQYILEEERDFNIFTSIADTKRIAKTNMFDLAINEAVTIFDKADDKYDLEFAHWGEYRETFEDYPNTLIKWTNSTYNEHGLEKSNIRAKDGTYSGYMGRETKGGSSVPDYYSEFEVVGDKVTFDYYNSFTQYNQKLMVYVNNVEAFNDSYNSTSWQNASIDLIPNKLNTVKIFYEDSTVDPSNDKGFFIDNLTCNAPIPEKNAVIYFKTFDYGMFDSPQGASIIFNDLEVSSNVIQTVYYSIDNRAEWVEFNGIIPNVDSITLKAVFTKPTVEEEAYVKFSSVTVEPGEFEYVSYADTSRKIYNKDDIKTVPLKNNTITMNPDRRYKLLFEDGSITTESFGDVPVIPYEFTGTDSYGEASIIENELASDGRCCELLYNASFSSTSVFSIPGIKFTVKSDKLTFKTKCTRGNGNQILYVYVNNNSKLSFYPKVSDEFETRTIELDPNVDSVVWMIYGSYVGGTYSLLIDDITIGSITPTDYSYVETRPVNISSYPSHVECSIETVDLQSTRELTEQYFYSVDDSEWIEFDGTLPNVENVRIKSLYTKASVDDVVDATFESIIIKPENIKNGEVITSYAGLERKVVKSVAINVDTYVNLIKDYIMVVRNYRRVVKDSISSFATLRKVGYNNKLIVDSDTLRILAYTAFSSQDLEREVIKPIKSKATILRKVIKTINSSKDLNRKVAECVYGEASLTRKVIAKEIKQLDANRIVHALVKVDITIDTKRVIYRAGVLYIPQLNANFKLSKGKLILTKQDF